MYYQYMFLHKLFVNPPKFKSIAKIIVYDFSPLFHSNFVTSF